MNRMIEVLLSSVAAVLVATSVQAQQVTGTPGEPGATTTIDGKQLPPPDPKFGGVIGEKASESKSWWAARVVPPKGAPNVLLIMTDDAGFGAPGTFGGVIPTPALDRIANTGLRYTNFHSTSLCSPTRAALITGRNHHVAGFGVVGEAATGFPGYNSVIRKENGTIGAILKMLHGTPNEFTFFNGVQVPVKDQFLWYPFWGSDRTFPHYAAGWAWAMSTPFKWVKQVASHFGGTAQGMAISWPGHINDVGNIRRQFHHVIDIVPTILEATGIPAPDTVNGIAQRPMDGVSMMYTLDKANANAPSRRTTQYFEMLGNRAIYNEGWVGATTPANFPWAPSTGTPPDVITGYKWELYNVMADPTQSSDLAAAMPDKLKQMQDLFYSEAKKYDVLPLDNSTLARFTTPRPSLTAGRTLFTYTGGLTGVPNSGAPSILNKSYTITAEVTIPKGGAEGMIVTDGGQFRGYALFLSKGVAGIRRSKPVFLYNLLDLKRTTWAGPELKAGKHTIVFDFKADSAGLGKGGTGVLYVNGKEVARNTMEHTTPITFPEDESFDVGQDTRTGVALVEYRYDPPFKFTGKIDKLTFKLEPQKEAKAKP